MSLQESPNVSCCLLGGPRLPTRSPFLRLGRSPPIADALKKARGPWPGPGFKKTPITAPFGLQRLAMSKEGGRTRVRRHRRGVPKPLKEPAMKVDGDKEPRMDRAMESASVVGYIVGCILMSRLNPCVCGSRQFRCVLRLSKSVPAVRTFELGTLLITNGLELRSRRYVMDASSMTSCWLGQARLGSPRSSFDNCPRFQSIKSLTRFIPSRAITLNYETTRQDL